MMPLPKEFIDTYHSILGHETQAFLASFQQEAVNAFRVNPLKKQSKSFEDPIPNILWGYYGKVSGKSPEHVSGLVYSQEPATLFGSPSSGSQKG